MTTKLDYAAKWWLRDEVAAYLGITPASVSHYVAKQEPATNPIPVPTYVGRTPRWRPAEIVAWHASRPGRGRRGQLA